MRIRRFATRTFSLIGCIAAALAAGACSPLGMVNAISPDEGATLVGSFGYGENDRQRLDLYRPSELTSTPLPTVLFVYGGSWKGGNRADYAFAGKALARAGFLVAVADYRVYPEVRFPDFVTDTAKAAAWLHENAGNHGGRADGIHLVGHSAGAHLVAMVALDETYLRAEGADRSILGRWVGLAGPYAFHPFDFDSVKDAFEGLQDEDQARPIVYAGPGAPPALLLHGASDTTVVPEHSVRLAETLNKAGVKASAHLYPDVTHGPIVAALSEPLDFLAPTLEHTTHYLKTGQAPAK